MSPARRIIPAAVAAIVIAGALLLARGLHGALRQQPSSATAGGAIATGRPLAIPLARAGAAGSRRARLSGIAVERRFVASYARYLDGQAPVSALRYVSITARDQATAAGRLPAAIKDGPLTVKSIVQTGVTAYSAQATVTVTNRQASYPFTVTLVHDDAGWFISGLTAPDLTADQPIAHATWKPMPALEQDAARRFAVGYVQHLAGARMPAMTATARREVTLGDDKLHSTTLPARARARVTRLRFGPLEGNEFAVTATLTAARRRLSFTFLMLHTRSGWECDAFL